MNKTNLSAVEGVVRTAKADGQYQALSADDVTQIAREVFQEVYA